MSEREPHEWQTENARLSLKVAELNRELDAALGRECGPQEGQDLTRGLDLAATRRWLLMAYRRIRPLEEEIQHLGRRIHNQRAEIARLLEQAKSAADHTE